MNTRTVWENEYMHARLWRGGWWHWAYIGLIGSLLAACAGGGTSVVVATATPLCHGGAPLSSTIGTVTTNDQVSATVTNATGTTQVIHFEAGARFSQLLPIATTDLTPNTPVQIVVQPDATNALPTASAIIVQKITGVTDAPSSCSATAQTSIPGVQGQITTINRNSQQITLIDSQGHLFVVAFSGTTIIGQPAAAQPADVTKGDLLLAVGNTAADGFDAQTIIILQTSA